MRIVANIARILFTAAVFLFPTAVRAQSAGELLTRAEQAKKAGKSDEALTLASQAVAEDPKDTKCLGFRAILFLQLGQNKEAFADFTKLIELDPTEPTNHHLRGCAQFKLGRVADSIQDFDKFLIMKPGAKPGHWQRGISLYYAGRYADGREQFEGYQTFDSNDVENAVWRFMCMAKSDGIGKARQDLLKIGNDQRVPMRQIYELFAGKLTPEKVMEAARAKDAPTRTIKRQLFYAHLYVGIYYDLEGDRKNALEHLTKAT